MRVAALLLLHAAAAAADLRDILSFNFGWRFALGNPGAPPAACNASSFPFNLTAQHCMGLSGQAGVASPADCEASACANGNTVWQWCSAPQCLPKSGIACWTGNNRSTCAPAKGSGWVGAAGSNAPPPPPPLLPAQPGFDDAAWDIVDAPHDALINTPYSPTANNGQGSIPKNVSWYRKRLVLPLAWRGSHVAVYVEGAFAHCRSFFNGQELSNHTGSGYTSFAIRLDNATTVNWGAENVLALFIDGTASAATGWWYEGSGLFRNLFLTRTALPARIADDSLFTPAALTGAVRALGPAPAAGLQADALLSPSLAVELPVGGSSGAVAFSATFAVYGAGGELVAQSAAAAGSGVAGQTVQLAAPPLPLPAAQLWSIARPYLYTVVASLRDGAGALVDSVNASLGVRSTAFDANEGLFLNSQRVKIRGFCNHASFASVGMAVPQRINLLRMQQMRGMGGNSWRMSHNPGCPATFALGDALGMTFLDENRVFKNGSDYVTEMGNMVRRDRQHPSILFWSFCNEAGCLAEKESAEDFKIITNALDPSRNVTMNYFLRDLEPNPTGSLAVVDVQGLSHPGLGDAEALHALVPHKPIGATECCSCLNQRDEDADLPLAPNSTVTYRSNSAPCQVGQTNVSDGRDWMFGQYIWTAHDYLGEPHGFPHVSSGYGQVDLAGFLKAPAFWFRAKWLAGAGAGDAGRPPLSAPAASAVVRIVETWQPNPQHPNRTIHVYTSAPGVALSVNGVSAGPPSAALASGIATWGSVPYAAGAVSAVTVGAPGGAEATHSRASWGAPAALRLTLDAPSPGTGTGRALYLDGGDVALVRATIVDAAGNVCSDAALNVSFAVAQGPGIVLGCGSGDPADRYPNSAPWKPAYHGLARAIVRVSLDGATPAAARALRASIDVEAGRGPRSSGVLPPGAAPPAALLVTASAPGLPPASVSIPLSVDPADAPLAVARSSVGAADLTEA